MMNDQIKSSVTNPAIANIYKQINNGEIIIRPDFQRRFVWTHDHQEEFIDTILRGFPFPEIYVCEGEVDLQSFTATKLVIDGQQRLTTIIKYIEGKHDRVPSKVPLFSALSDAQKKTFLGYQLVVRDIGKVDDETIKEIFRRINLTKFKLENVEIQNAIYDGKFIETAKTILDQIDINAFGVLRESEMTRMADLHFILLVMATLECGGYFAQDREVENKIAALNDDYPNSEQMFANIKSAFEVIKDLELPSDSMWFRKGNFFTLVVEVASHLGSLPPNFKDKLLTFETNVQKYKQDRSSYFGKYYHHMYQATHGRTSRVVRSDYFRKECLGIKGEE